MFAVIWASFGVLHFYRINEIASLTGRTKLSRSSDLRLGFCLGFFGGVTVVSVTGVGIDMLVYAALVLLCRADLKIAIPSSVVIMAITSVYGLLLKSVTTGLHPGVFENWLAAAPIVALGAPLGVAAVYVLGRKLTLLFVATLCLLQFIWTCMNEYHYLNLIGTVAAIVSVIVVVLLFEQLRHWGGRLENRRVT